MPNGPNVSPVPDHFINRGSDLRQLYEQAKNRHRGSEFVPKSVSRIQGDVSGNEEFVVLWGRGLPIWALPPAIPARMPG